MILSSSVIVEEEGVLNLEEMRGQSLNMYGVDPDVVEYYDDDTDHDEMDKEEDDGTLPSIQSAAATQQQQQQ